MDAIIAHYELLRALNSFRLIEEQSANKKHSLLDEIIDLHCTPMGVSIPGDVGHGVARNWNRVGSYLRRMMHRDLDMVPVG